MQQSACKCLDRLLDVLVLQSSAEKTEAFDFPIEIELDVDELPIFCKQYGESIASVEGGRLMSDGDVLKFVTGRNVFVFKKEKDYFRRMNLVIKSTKWRKRFEGLVVLKGCSRSWDDAHGDFLFQISVSENLLNVESFSPMRFDFSLAHKHYTSLEVTGGGFIDRGSLLFDGEHYKFITPLSEFLCHENAENSRKLYLLSKTSQEWAGKKIPESRKISERSKRLFRLFVFADGEAPHTLDDRKSFGVVLDIESEMKKYDEQWIFHLESIEKLFSSGEISSENFAGTLSSFQTENNALFCRYLIHNSVHRELRQFIEEHCSQT